MDNKNRKKLIFCLLIVVIVATAYAQFVMFANKKAQANHGPQSKNTGGAVAESGNAKATSNTADGNAATAATTAHQPLVADNEHIKIPTIQAGVHYKRLTEKIRSKPSIRQLTSSSANKVQVLIFFSYGCSVCKHLNKPFDEWANKQDSNKVMISKHPVSFNHGWETLAQAYYAVQALGKSATLDEVIFTGIHEKSQPLWKQKNLEELLAQHGVDKTAFQQAFTAFSVKTQAKAANDLSIAFELAAIPNIIVNGPSSTFVTNLSMTKSPELLFAVVDHLIQKEMKENTQPETTVVPPAAEATVPAPAAT